MSSTAAENVILRRRARNSINRRWAYPTTLLRSALRCALSTLYTHSLSGCVQRVRPSPLLLLGAIPLMSARFVISLPTFIGNRPTRRCALRSLCAEMTLRLKCAVLFASRSVNAGLRGARALRCFWGCNRESRDESAGE